jgi:hypothetical protein
MEKLGGVVSPQMHSFNLRGRLASCRWLWIISLIWALSPAGRGFGADATAPSPAPNPADPILDLMLEKGLITEGEAARVKAESEAIRTNEMARYDLSKWKISDDKGIKSVELFGDIRLRYESRTVTDPSDGSITSQRYRYAVRIGLRGEVFDDFYYGFRLETSQNPRSSFVTFGTSSGSGPFNKNESGSAAIEVGQVYLGWKPENWVDVTLGKMPNPIFTTTMVWSGSINPEGAAERFKYTVGEADFFATFGQFIYQDTSPQSSAPGYGYNWNSSYTPFLMAWQGGVNYHLTKKISLKVAPVIYNYTGSGVNLTGSTTSVTPGYNNTYVGQGTTLTATGQKGGYYNYPAGGQPSYNGYAANQTGINNLLVLEIPAELNIQLDQMSLRVFGDYAQNLQGGDRATAAWEALQGSSSPYATSFISPIASPQTHDITAYQAGVAIGSKDCLGLVNGSVSSRHAWEFRTYWQHVEQYALDPNLIDTDFFNAAENLQGVYAAFAYGFADNVIGTVRYGYATRINDKLGTGGSSPDISAMNPINSYNIFQVDMTFRF